MVDRLLPLLNDELLDTTEPLHAKTDLFAAGLDSMGIMQLLLLIEDHFGIALEPTDLSRENFQTPEKIAALLEQKTAS